MDGVIHRHTKPGTAPGTLAGRAPVPDEALDFTLVEYTSEDVQVLHGVEVDECRFHLGTPGHTGNPAPLGDQVPGPDHHLRGDAPPVRALATDQPALHAGHREPGPGSPQSALPLRRHDENSRGTRDEIPQVIS